MNQNLITHRCFTGMRHSQACLDLRRLLLVDGDLRHHSLDLSSLLLEDRLQLFDFFSEGGHHRFRGPELVEAWKMVASGGGKDGLVDRRIFRCIDRLMDWMND